jgi:serine O-acetyltransferase
MYINAISFYRVAHYFYIKKIPLLPKIFEALIYLFTNCSIPACVKIGDGTYCGHRGIGVVIHPDAVIGRNCVLRAHVVIGGKGGGVEGAPIIEDDVEFGAGAKILGPIKISCRSSIGANAVVLSDVPANAVAIGVPAKIFPKTER